MSDSIKAKSKAIPKKYFNTVLVAIMRSKIDLEIARTKHWYRIPVKPAPVIVKNGNVKTIAFYQTKDFKEEKYSVRYYADVENISIVKRKELFPNEVNDPKAEDDYYKIDIGPLIPLKEPIISKRGRRIIFIPTSKEKFSNATEINDLFNSSILEDILWKKFRENNIAAEREFHYGVDDQHYFLDFAIFCNRGNIDVECDGDQFHTGREHVYYDKNRNNLLESEGWSVLRFTYENLTLKPDEALNIIRKTIRNYGGEKTTIQFDGKPFIISDKKA
jgi:very-short-patch-repair endonuclease